MNRTVVFVGPTLDPAVVQARLPAAIVLPPAGQADLISAVRQHRPRVIGLIDGYFRRRLSVWHKEILYALEHGVHVYGASSMGALRAAELSAFGMVGVGDVYRRFASGELDRDDEVALAHGDADSGYRALSVPLVNIRATLEDAVAAGVLSPADAEAVVDAGSSLHYPDRQVDRIVELAVERGLDPHVAGVVGDVVRTDFRDVKRDDAVQLLDVLATLPDDLPPFEIDYEVERPHVMESMIERDIVFRHGGVDMTQADLAYHVALHMAEFPTFNFNALNRLIAVSMSRLLGMSAEAADIDREERRHRLRYRLTDDERFAEWCAANDVTVTEYRSLMEEVALCRRLHDWALTQRNYRGSAQLLADTLRLEDSYTTWAEDFARKEALVGAGADVVDAAMARLSATSLEEMLVDHLRATPCRIDTNYRRWSREAGFREARTLAVELERSRRARAAAADLMAQLSDAVAEADPET